MDLQMIEKIQKVVNKAEIVDLSYTLKRVCRFDQRTQDLVRSYMKLMMRVRFPIIDRFVMESIREPIWMPRGIFLKKVQLSMQ